MNKQQESPQQEQQQQGGEIPRNYSEGQRFRLRGYYDGTEFFVRDETVFCDYGHGAILPIAGTPHWFDAEIRSGEFIPAPSTPSRPAGEGEAGEMLAELAALVDESTHKRGRFASDDDFNRHCRTWNNKCAIFIALKGHKLLALAAQVARLTNENATLGHNNAYLNGELARLTEERDRLAGALKIADDALSDIGDGEGPVFERKGGNDFAERPWNLSEAERRARKALPAVRAALAARPAAQTPAAASTENKQTESE